MRRNYRTFEARPSRAPLLILVVVIAVSFLGWAVVRNQGPVIRLVRPVKTIGVATPVEFSVTDSAHAIKRAQLGIEQNGRKFILIFTAVKTALPKRAAWKFWQGSGSEWQVHAVAGKRTAPALADGAATLRLVAVNNSWGRFFRGGRSVFAVKLPVRVTPPRIDVLTQQDYINQGGSGLVVFKVSPADAKSGVQVGNLFFPSWPVNPSQTETRLCLFAFPYNADLSTPVRIVARDDAGNDAVAEFAHEIVPQVFRKRTLFLSRSFLERAVPAILRHMPKLKNEGSLLKNFLEINNQLRAKEARQLAALSHDTRPRFLWSGAFLALANSQVEARFADRRTYVYNGQVIGHHSHLGFDLASVEHAPVLAANSGVVVMTRYFGIYGNAIVIDHGCGLESLYAHLESFAVKVGERVVRGQLIGHTDTTGLAEGDHLHFAVLVDGVPVNPLEWWDPRWIKSHIEAQLALAR